MVYRFQQGGLNAEGVVPPGLVIQVQGFHIRVSNPSLGVSVELGFGFVSQLA